MNQTAIKQVEKWLRMRKSNRYIRCPFSIDIYNASGIISAMSDRNGHGRNRSDLCREIIGDEHGGKACARKSIGGSCPCSSLGVDVVSSRARLYVKAY